MPKAHSNDHKVEICHVEGSGERHTIEIDEHAVDAHQEHGDTLGACIATTTHLVPATKVRNFRSIHGQ